MQKAEQFEVISLYRCEWLGYDTLVTQQCCCNIIITLAARRNDL